MDQRTIKIMIAAGAGIALAYFMNKPKEEDAAAPGAPGAPTKPSGFDASAALSYGGGSSFDAGGGGGGGGGGDTGKTAQYGRQNVRQYQQRLNWLRNLLVANKLNADKTGIPYIPLNAGRGDYTKVDAYGGEWGPKTQSAADALKRFVVKTLQSPTKGAFVAAMAAAGNGSEPDYEMKLGKALMSFDTKKVDGNDIAAFAFALK
jgi:hypothetical protein